MDSVHKLGCDVYRLIVARRGASEILLAAGGNGWSLPSVEIARGQRIAEQLTAELYLKCGCCGYCLFFPSVAGELAKCAVMEARAQDEPVAAGTCWTPLSAAKRSLIDSAEDRAILGRSIEELNSCRKEPSLGPFARPGWMAELFEWVDQRIAPLGLRLTGSFTQLNASPAFSLVRMETNHSAVWFKATGEPNRHELQIVECLSQLFSECVPRLLGVHTAWNGWLTGEVSGTRLDQSAEPSSWTNAVEELAQLQIRSVGKQAELLEGQCKDLRLPKLAERIDPFIDRMREFMAAQEKQTPAPLTNPELTRLRNRLKQAYSLLCEAGLPDALGHLDFNPGNIFIAPERCVFLDWSEACVTHPLVTFEYFREHFQRSCSSDPMAIERLATTYIRPWRSVVSDADWKQATVFSPLVAVFAYAAAANQWRSIETSGQCSHAGYFRSLTRRMYREAEQIPARSERCLA